MKSDVVQIHLLTFAPFGNANCDEAGHPKTMSLLDTVRGRWSAQSQKAALRAAPHLSSIGCGVRSRNLAIETYERLALAGIGERLCFAGAEIVLAGLGSNKGALRSSNECVDALASAFVKALGSRGVDSLKMAFPEFEVPKGKKRKLAGDATETDDTPEEGIEAGKASLKDVCSAFAKMASGADKVPFRRAAEVWDDKWAVVGDLFERLVRVAAEFGVSEDASGAMVEIFRGDQPLLFSTYEIAWKNMLEAEAAAAWSADGASGVGRVFEKFAPKGKVVSPMPEGAIDADLALFGRMVAQSSGATVEAAVSMAHSATVCEFDVEADLFTAREERPRNSNDQGGHLGYAFWGSGIHYRYMAIDMNLLVANLSKGRSPTEAHAIAEQICKAVTVDFSQTSPRGKSTNSAIFSPASYVMIERGSGVATNLMIAFSKPIPRDADDKMSEAISRLKLHKAALTKVYGKGKGRIAEVCSYPDAVVEGPTSFDSVEAAFEAVS